MRKAVCRLEQLISRASRDSESRGFGLGKLGGHDFPRSTAKADGWVCLSPLHLARPSLLHPIAVVDSSFIMAPREELIASAVSAIIVVGFRFRSLTDV